MGETIDETRLEIASQRAELETTADRLRDALDLGKRIRENPGVVIGIGAAAAFARKAIARFLTDEQPPATSLENAAAAGSTVGPTRSSTAGPAAEDYAGWSKRT